MDAPPPPETPAVEAGAAPLVGAALAVGLAIAAAAMLLFVWLGEEVLEGETRAVDRWIRDAIHGHAVPGLTTVMVAASRWGAPRVLAFFGVVAAVVFLMEGWRRAAVLVLVTMVVIPVAEGTIDMAWLALFLAGLLEVGWAIGLKYTHGFSRFWPSLATVICMILSLGLLAHALKTLPIGTAYAVWTGIGTVGTALLGIVLFSEPSEALRLGCILLIIIGIVGLRLLG